MILHILTGFISTVCFSVIFNVPRNELVFCGITGAFGWGIFKAFSIYGANPVMATFFATLIITFMSRHFAFRRKMPITVFLISGIIPLVPGAGIYYTMYDVFLNELNNATAKGVQTLKIAGVIAFGIILILTLPKKLFMLSVRKDI